MRDVMKSMQGQSQEVQKLKDLMVQEVGSAQERLLIKFGQEREIDRQNYNAMQQSVSQTLRDIISAAGSMESSSLERMRTEFEQKLRVLEDQAKRQSDESHALRAGQQEE